MGLSLSYDVEWSLWDSLSVFTGLSFSRRISGEKLRLDGLNSGMEHDVVRDLGAFISIFGEGHKGRPCYHAVSVCVNKD
jgi:hypothetical protein